MKCGSEVLYREVVGGCDYTVHYRATVTHTNGVVMVKLHRSVILIQSNQRT